MAAQYLLPWDTLNIGLEIGLIREITIIFVDAPQLFEG